MASAAKATSGHNVQTEQEQYEEQQFHRGLSEIRSLKSEIAGTTSEIGHVYKRLKEHGFTKADMKWAMELEDKDRSEVISTMERRLRIARMMGHPIARQLDMLDKDRTPAEDAAYEEGLGAGKGRKANSNPYDQSSIQGQRWQAGFNDGTAFINKELDVSLNGAEAA
jgi:uncharacterized protein (UPF0335 family)